MSRSSDTRAAASTPWWRRPPRSDAWTIMGMRSPWTAVTAVAVISVAVVLGFAAGGVLSPIRYVAAMLVMLASVGVLLGAAADPLGRWATAFIVSAPPAAIAFAIPGLTPRAGMAYATLTGVAVIITGLLTVRGRPYWAWAGYVLGVVVELLAIRYAGPRPALLVVQAPNLTVQLIATVFAAIVRPRAQRIYALREGTEREAVARSAHEATLAVRDQQMTGLNEGARDLLDRIAAGHGLDAEQLERCRLVEARLRDRIRAPGFDNAPIAAAAWRARSAGVRVVLLDDLVADSRTAAAPAIAAVSAELVGMLDGAQAGDEVTARLLPAGRRSLATLAQSSRGRVVRVDFDGDGRRIDAQPAL
ncbi:MAG: hypothetical protein WBA05_06510 [Gordonia sp. (in: high G+C Gram-positive bacteria)]|uniref:hypothetical protein n=1 Tax=Gordonia TaxID=2053 RepID=UPI003266CF7F